MKKILALALLAVGFQAHAQMTVTQPLSLFSNKQPVQAPSNTPGTLPSSLVEKRDYLRIQVDPSKTLAPASLEKPVVIEFFWYGCGHCYQMEPMLNKLQKDRSNDFTIKKYPVAFPRWESGALMYFTLEEMGLVDKLHEKVFHTVQAKRQNILDDKKLRNQFLVSEGVDVAKFDSHYKSFSVATKLNQAKEAVKFYKIDSSPTFVVNNTYVVNPGLSQTYEKTISTLNTVLTSVKVEPAKKEVKTEVKKDKK